MIKIQSRYSANGETSVIGEPFVPAKGHTCVAAVITAPSGRAARRTLRKLRKFAESEGE